MKRSVFNMIRVLIWLLPVAVVSWILVLNLVPSGTASLTYHQGETRDYISKFDQSESYGPVFKDRGQKWRTVLAEKASFFIRSWRPFSGIDLTISLLHPTTRVVLKGVDRTDSEDNSKVVFLPEIEGYRDWDAIQTGGTLLLQRRRQFSSIDEFKASPPPADEISLFKTDLRKTQTIGAEPERTEHRVQQAFRGSHWFRMYVTAAKPEIKLTVQKHDLNQKSGPDRLAVLVYGPDHSNRFAQTIEDDGSENVDGAGRAPQRLEVKLTDLPAGEYRLGLLANDEVVVDSIETANGLMYLVGPYQPQADADHPVTITARGRVVFGTNHSEAEASLWINDRELKIPPQSDFRHLNDESINVLTIKSPAVSVNTDYGFTLGDLVNYYEPYGLSLLTRTEADQLGVNYVIAQYNLPQRTAQDSYRVTAQFKTAGLFLNGDQYGFSLESDTTDDSNFAIGNVTVRFNDARLTFASAFRLLKSWAGTAIRSVR